MRWSMPLSSGCPFVWAWPWARTGWRPSSLMWVLGIIGGIGSGKTTLARMLGELGAAVIRADEIGHCILERPEAKEALVRRFGRTVLTAQGAVDRARVARVVFDREADLRWL